MNEEIGPHYDDLAMQMEDLRTAFNRSVDKGNAYLKIFDEFIEENDFGLALHVLCDYLLEPDIPAIEELQLEKIAALHSLMQIEDTCVKELRAKQSTPALS